MCLLARDEQQGAGGDGFNVRKGMEVHEFYVAGQCGMRGQFRRLAAGGEFASRSTVEFIEFLFNGVGIFVEFMHRAAGVFGCPSGEFHITLFRRFRENLLPLFKSLRFPESVAAGRTHVIHADGGDGFQPRVDFGGADGKASAAANPDGPDAAAVDKRARAQKVHGRAESFGIHVRRYGVAGFSRTFTPEGEINGQRHESPFSHFHGVQVRTLFLDGAHGMPHDDGWVFRILVHVSGQEQVSRHLHFILVVEFNFLRGDLAALVEVVRVRGLVRRAGDAAGHDERAQGRCREVFYLAVDDGFRVHCLFLSVCLIEVFSWAHEGFPACFSAASLPQATGGWRKTGCASPLPPFPFTVLSGLPTG